MTIVIDSMHPDDWAAVREIYQQGIATGDATFETEVPEWEVWNEKHLPICRLVARSGSSVVGWAALSPVSSRKVYAGVAEVSVYVHESARGQGLGKLLLQALVAESEHRGFWTLQAGIMRENTASIALHRAGGFREVGYRERIGRLNGVWRDTVLLERRSRAVGV